MKKSLSILVMLLSCLFCHAKYYVGYTTTAVNLRECAGTTCNIISKLKPQELVLYNTDEIDNGFYKVIYLDKDMDGYIHSKYIKPYQEIVVDENGSLQKIGQSADMWPTISIENDSYLNMSLRMNSKSYRFKPHEKREIVSDPGQCCIIAFVAGALPYISADVLENNMAYEWIFRVVQNTQNGEESQAYISDEDKLYFHKIQDCPLSLGSNYLISVKAAVDSGRKACTICYNIKK